VGSSELGRSTGAPVIRALAGLVIPSSCRAPVRGVATHRADQAAAVQAHCGTEGLNPSLSTGESANFWFLGSGAPSRALWLGKLITASRT